MPAGPPVITPRERRPGAACEPVPDPALGPAEAVALATVAKALADPTRLRIVAALREAAPEAVCQCELLPLFGMSQPALAKHLAVLVGSGVIGRERRGLWAYYFVPADTATAELRAWLG